jgi:hypothetical protein
MLHDTRRTRVTWPCPEDPGFDATTANCRHVPAQQFSATGVIVVLPKKPEIGSLLTVKLSDQPADSAPLVARVTAIQRQPEGWFTHCEWLERMPEEDLHSLLTPDRVAL